MEHKILFEIEQLKHAIENLQVLSKEIYDVEELSHLLRLSTSTIHKLTHSRSIPFFKPHGKKIFFLKSDVLAWVTKNPIRSKCQL